jgi:uncharacterized protein (TIGR02453 family)
VRFANDKRPYKENAGAVLNRGGGKMSPGMIYIHLSPAGCFSAAGYYHPEAPTLAAIRRVIAERPATWREVAAALAKAGLELSQTDKLTRAPRGFEGVVDADLVEALKLKSLMVSINLERADMADARLIERLADFAESASPIFRLA